jgi:tryptophan synthase alpha chain
LNRLEAKFKELSRSGRKAFIPYITAGDPDLETSLKLILELERSGADIIELGVPFSDPMADGPVIQRASERALRRGVSARNCLELVKELRQTTDIPIVLFSYLNPLLALDVDVLGESLSQSGVDAVLATDLVPEEAEEFIRGLRSAGISTVFLVAPTSTDERIKRVCGSSNGFVYALSRTGVTGIRQSLSEACSTLVKRIRLFTDLPIAVGFGISTAEHVNEVWKHADGAVVGSRIVAEIEDCVGAPDTIRRVGNLVRALIPR